MISKPRISTLASAFVLAALQVAWAAEGPEREPIKMKIIAQNPSHDDVKTILIKEDLPREVTRREHILSTGGLKLEFDGEKSVFRVRSPGPIRLQPEEMRTFTVELENVWYIDENHLDELNSRAGRALASLEGSEHYEAARRISDEIGKQLDAIKSFQTNEAIPRDQYMIGYRYNVERLKGIRGDIETIESYSNIKTRPEVLESESDLASKPSKAATWLVIFVILTFLGIMAGIFFYVWQRHARTLEGTISEARGAAFPGSDEAGEGESS
jgi:hypothetical protein